MAPKGCSLDDDGGGVNLRCHGDDSLHHAVAVVNLQFGWCMVLMTVFVLAFYVHACKKYPAGEATTTIATYLYGRLPEAQWRSQNLNIRYSLTGVWWAARSIVISNLMTDVRSRQSPCRRRVDAACCTPYAARSAEHWQPTIMPPPRHAD